MGQGSTTGGGGKKGSSWREGMAIRGSGSLSLLSFSFLWSNECLVARWGLLNTRVSGSHDSEVFIKADPIVVVEAQRF